MELNLELMREEGLMMQRLHAFQLYQNLGEAVLDSSFPKLKPFVLENKHKTYEQLEKEQFKELEKFKNK